jgi:hypothetical protein
VLISLKDLFTPVFLLALTISVISSPLNHGFARPGFYALSFLAESGQYKSFKAIYRIQAVLVLAAKTLSFDHDNPFTIYATVLDAQKSRFAVIREARLFDIKSKVYGGGQFVDVLTARSLGANCRQLKLRVRYYYVVTNFQFCNLCPSINDLTCQTRILKALCVITLRVIKLRIIKLRIIKLRMIKLPDGFNGKSNIALDHLSSVTVQGSPTGDWTICTDGKVLADLCRCIRDGDAPWFYYGNV